MRAVQNSQDAALRALRARYAAAPLNLHEDMVAVHRVLDCVAPDIHIPVELRDGSVWHYKSVAIGMKDQTALDLIATGNPQLWVRSRGGGSSRLLLTGFWVRPARRQTIATAGQLLNGAAFLQFGEHFEQGPSVRFLQPQAFGKLAGGDRFAPKL